MVIRQWGTREGYGDCQHSFIVFYSGVRYVRIDRASTKSTREWKLRQEEKGFLYLTNNRKTLQANFRLHLKGYNGKQIDIE